MRSTALRSLALLVFLVSSTLYGQEVPELTGQGSEALGREEYYAAIGFFRLALQQNAFDLVANAGLAEAYYWLDEHDQAWTYVEEARRLAITSPDVRNLQARIAIGLARLDDAELLFREVLEDEPNNVGAQIGLAELALAKGQSADAAMSLEQALTLNPEHRKTLLSLVLVYEQLGETDAAERFLELAQSVHRDSPEVHILAAQYHLRSGDLVSAGRAARTAQAIDPFNRVAAQLRAEIAYLQKDYVEARATTEELLATDRNDTVAWFLRAQTLLATDSIDEALTSLRTILRIDPDDEMVRIVAEAVALEHLPLASPVRTDLARYPWNLAQSYRSSYRYTQALSAYQRALRLSPFDTELRSEYAELHRSLGNLATYLEEIKIVQSESEPNPDLDRRVEVYEGALSARVAAQWGIDQFTYGRTRIRIGVYTAPDTNMLRRVDSDAAIATFASQTLQSQDRMRVIDTGVIPNFAAAFQRARSQDVDYFILLAFLDGERNVQLTADLYLGRTGTAVGELQFSRTGQYRVNEAVTALAVSLAALFPIRARVVSVAGREVALDVGSRDDVSVGEKLTVIPPEVIAFDPESIAFTYPPDAVLGTITLSAVDDLISTGVFTPVGLSSEVKTGDIAFIPGSSVIERSTDELYPVLYERVRQIR